jgi:hypothetical protein
VSDLYRVDLTSSVLGDELVQRSRVDQSVNFELLIYMEYMLCFWKVDKNRFHKALSSAID